MSESDSDLSSDDLSEETASWIAWFCSIRGNEFFAMVDEEYITDSFNLSGLKEEVPHYELAVETILDADQPALQQMTETQQESVDSAAELLYGLIHARFIVTAKGLTLMVSAAWGPGATRLGGGCPLPDHHAAPGPGAALQAPQLTSHHTHTRTCIRTHTCMRTCTYTHMTPLPFPFLLHLHCTE